MQRIGDAPDNGHTLSMIFRNLAVLVAVILMAASPARAQTLFGTVEDIHPLEDVALTGPDGAALFLGHKTSTVYFVGGVRISDDGYILGLRSDPSRILDLPAGEDLAKFQSQSLLPDPLPAYSVGWFDYVRGYSLWLVILALVGVYALVVMMRPRVARRRR